jgi:hypothetical protein
MDEPMTEPRRCTVCGDPIRKNNTYGICGNGKKPACRKARWEAKYKTGPQPERKLCEVCNRPIRRDNGLGICERQDSPECLRERMRRFREQAADPAIRRCEICGRRLRRDNSMGICGGNSSRECARERDRRRGWQRGVSSVPEGWTPPPYIEAGTVFERLTVLEDVRGSKDPVRCKCNCISGTEKIVSVATDLTSGSVRSCGCLRRELHLTHGLSNHPLYRTWAGIIKRCTDPSNSAYPNYGGRGIKVCERWLDLATFIEDIEREIGPRPEVLTASGWPEYSLDRYPDNDGNYEPGNVRWADQHTQKINQRKVATLTRQIEELTARLALLENGS